MIVEVPTHLDGTNEWEEDSISGVVDTTDTHTHMQMDLGLYMY